MIWEFTFLKVLGAFQHESDTLFYIMLQSLGLQIMACGLSLAPACFYMTGAIKCSTPTIFFFFFLQFYMITF